LSSSVVESIAGDVEQWVSEDKVHIGQLVDRIESVFRGKRPVVEIVMAALLARGHVLLEDVPGTGKTTLARCLAVSLDGSFRRIQFTSDLLPSDVMGVSVYRDTTGEFEFRPGPIFASIVLADEINRTPPRTQSALLEALSEGRVTVDNTTHDLPDPFMVIATQNPREFHGAYPLPESQLDRFLLCIDVGYPDRAVERSIVEEYGYDDPVASITPAATMDEVRRWQKRVAQVRVEPTLVDYMMGLVEATRNHPHLDVGLSTRGAICLHKAAQSIAYVRGRAYVTPDDIAELVVPVCSHRVWIRAQYDAGSARRTEAAAILNDIVESVPVPR